MGGGPERRGSLGQGPEALGKACFKKRQERVVGGLKEGDPQEGESRGALSWVGLCCGGGCPLVTEKPGSAEGLMS